MQDKELQKPKAQRKRGRPSGDHELKRQELVEAIIDEVATHGLMDASLRKLSLKLGCSTGTMTYYFKNKQRMVVAISDYIFKEFEEMLTKDGAPQCMKIILSNWLAWVDRKDTNIAAVFSELLVYAKSDSNFAAHLHKKYASIKAALAQSIQKAQLEKKVRSDIPSEILSEQLTALVDGWLLTQPLGSRGSSPIKNKEFVSSTWKLISL